MDHPARRDDILYGSVELRGPPPNRTHAGMCADARNNEAHEREVLAGNANKCDAPYKRTGVKELSPLALLPLFDVVWDMLPDMMHIIPAVMKGHIMPMMKGLRAPAKPKMRATWSGEENAELLANWEKVKRQLVDWQVSEVCTLLSTL
jgi:hypothetical protein